MLLIVISSVDAALNSLVLEHMISLSVYAFMLLNYTESYSPFWVDNSYNIDSPFVYI